VAAVVRDKESSRHFAELAHECQARCDSMIQATGETEGGSAVTPPFRD